MKRVAKKQKRSPPSVATYKVCDKCGAHCPMPAKECACGGHRFAPCYIREMRRINRALSVQVKDPHPDSAKTDPVISLYKWWPGGRANFNILTPAQWEAIKNVIDKELGPILGWVSSSAAQRGMKQTVGTADLVELSKQYPERFAELVAALKIHIEMPSGEENERLYAAISDLISHFDRASISRVTRIVTSLKEEGATNVKQLDEVLTDWSLSQATSVLRETKRRLATIELLRESLKNPSTFELRGESSIHSILEQDLWLLDESYWIIQSNRTLKSFIGERLAAKDHREFGKRRPDFVCGTLGDQLIIVELKRPSHELKKGDLNQIEDYLAISEKYSTKFKGYKAYLLGSTISDEIRTYLRYRRGVTVLNYWEVLDAAEKRYGKFLKYRERTSDSSSEDCTRLCVLEFNRSSAFTKHR
jgi:hypothetical protein